MIYDVIVIGSGPGGGPVAHHLNKSGAKTLLVEAGKYYRKDTFPRTEAEASAQLYWGGGIEFDKEARMGFLRTRMVGGSSIVFQSLMDRFDDIAFSDWRAESGVDWFTSEHMAPYYDTVEAKLKLHTFSPEERNNNAKRFVAACDELGYKWHNLRRGQDDCGREEGNDCIACLNGCHRDSKQSSMVAYIQEAEQNGLEIATETEITQIVPAAGTVKIYGTKPDGSKVSYEGKKVVLAGGSFGSTKMMLQSGFKKQLPALGKYFSSHPQFMWFGIFDQPIDAHKGYFQTVASKDLNFRKEGFKLENVFAGPVSTALLFSGYGAQHLNWMKKYRNLSCIEVAVRDENVGEIKVTRSGKLEVSKPLTDQDKSRRDKGLNAIRNILTHGGAKEVIEAPMYFGLHLMGGCVMGTDPNKSVVDPEFRVHGQKNIYICDSSIYPNAPGINPSLNIYALSQKLGEQLSKH
jgi:choline dehydrogenase-like flavoprotein